jgi:NTE family protein
MNHRKVKIMSEPTIGLALSGGGYRVTLFSLGTLWRLNELGLLSKIKTITSVSGGSITAGYLACNWDSLDFNENTGIATNFSEAIAAPLIEFCSENLDVGSVLSGLISFKDTIGDKVAKKYDKKLFKGRLLDSISENAPQFIFYGTNLQTGSSIRFTQKYISDWRLGINKNTAIPMSKAVGISSAFSPVLSPVTLKVNPADWEKTKISSSHDIDQLKTKLLLTDGGLYDNLGLEALTKGDKEYSHVICCDAGAPFEVKSNIATNWVRQFARMTDIMINQQRALRKRKLISDYIDEANLFSGTYLGICTAINDYKYPDSMTKDNEITASLSKISTRLKAFSKSDTCRLINWGYAISDTAVNRWCPELLDLRTQIDKPKWPFTEYKLN